MIESKHFNKIAWIITASALVIAILFMNGAALGIKVMTPSVGYADRLFNRSKVHTIEITMDDWGAFIDSTSNEEYSAANLVIDGESFKNIGIRGKGNTSLSSVSAMGSDRYSFKIEFDQYDSNISYHGLDKLNLNNLIHDSTMMKDYLTYTMMDAFGVRTPLCSFVSITVNGKAWGLYLAVEGVEESFLERNYGSDYGKLYKPDSMSFGGGRGNGKSFEPETLETSADLSTMPKKDSGSFDPSVLFKEDSNKKDGKLDFGSGFGMGSSDVKLQYIDDVLDSYSNIWNNAKTDITQADQYRLIASLKKLSDSKDLESVLDVEQVIRYFIVHNYVCNDDSYTGMMVHNYYLYEKDGRLSMIPWDYNLAFGTFGSEDASNTVNTPIDTPVASGSSDRPMLNWIFENKTYKAQYHQYFSEFLSSVNIQNIIDKAYNLIKSYVKEDPTSFYTYAEFEQGVKTLKQFCSLRSDSIKMQLKTGETADSMNYVDASAVTLSDMGTMERGAGGFGSDTGSDSEKPSQSAGKKAETAAPPLSEGAPDQAAQNKSDKPDTSQIPKDFSPDSDPPGSSTAENTPTNLPGWLLLAVSAVILIIGLMIAKKYKA